MSISIEDKNTLKNKIKDLLSELISKPNKDILSITASYDPNLDTVTLKYTSLKDDSTLLIFDEPV